jgi:hypothetical protein
MRISLSRSDPVRQLVDSLVGPMYVWSHVSLSGLARRYSCQRHNNKYSIRF